MPPPTNFLNSGFLNVRGKGKMKNYTHRNSTNPFQKSIRNSLLRRDSASCIDCLQNSMSKPNCIQEAHKAKATSCAQITATFFLQKCALTSKNRKKYLSRDGNGFFAVNRKTTMATFSHPVDRKKYKIHKTQAQSPQIRWNK